MPADRATEGETPPFRYTKNSLYRFPGRWCDPYRPGRRASRIGVFATPVRTLRSEFRRLPSDRIRQQVPRFDSESVALVPPVLPLLPLCDRRAARRTEQVPADLSQRWFANVDRSSEVGRALRDPTKRRRLLRVASDDVPATKLEQCKAADQRVQPIFAAHITVDSRPNAAMLRRACRREVPA